MSLAHNIENGQRTQDVLIGQDITFDTMLLAPNTLNGLRNSGFYKPSPIQLHGIPLGKCGFDLLLEAKSGTGKTAVFTVIALEKLDLKKGLQCIMLAPTREIAAQICDVIKQIGSAYKGLKVEVVMGGLPVQSDICKFKDKNVHIVVGSPGRLRHLIQDKHINTSSVRLLVIDEADKLMEKSFLQDINYIFSTVPKEKQVIMSSATYPDNTRPFIDKYMQSAQHICPETNSILLGIDQKITKVKYNSNIVKQTQHRFEELLKILTKKEFKQCLIFCTYQVRVRDLHKLLTRNKWPAEQLYGLQEQTDRLDAIKNLQEYKCRILISTDLAARGIDASNVDLVINFEPPIEWQTYLHRIGRAGRFGSYGLAITILSEGKEENSFREILNTLKLSLNYFWDDEVFNSNYFEEVKVITKNVVQQTEHVKINHDIMWNILTCDSKESHGDEVEDFENLCKSYEQSLNVNTDTFEDLLSSFQNHENKTISDDKESIDDKNFYEANNSYTVLKTQVMSLKSNFETNEEIPKSQIPDDTQQRKIYSNIKIPDDTQNSKLTNETDCYNTIEALQMAGLPTAFCSYRDKKAKKSYKEGISHEKDSDEWNMKSNIKKKQCKVNNKEKRSSIPKETSKYTKASSSMSNKYCTQKYEEETESDVSDDDFGYHSLSQQQFGPRTAYDTRSVINGSRYKTFHPGNQQNKQVPSELQDYTNWYNQLKYTVKQIELAVYLDEMSKF